MRRKQFLAAAFTYSALLNFKHIYLYASLAFFIYLLKEYVLAGQDINKKFNNLTKLALVTIIPFIVSFLPFIIVGGFSQLTQIFKRLFPFQRGLIHNYWAPNFWAFYYFLDKIVSYFSSRLGFQSITTRNMG